MIDDCLIIGGGVVGLSIAYELASHGMRVTVIDQGDLGRAASWAGAGILPAAKFSSDDSDYDQLSGLSRELHAQWSAKLRDETGIDNEFHVCGILFVARDPGDAARLEHDMEKLPGRHAVVQEVLPDRLHEIEPAIRSSAQQEPVIRALYQPDCAQLRNPRHLKALIAACEKRGVRLVANAAAEEFVVRNGGLQDVTTRQGAFRANRYCLCAGAWSNQLAQSVGVKLNIKPIRGQIALLRSPKRFFQAIVHEEPKYMVPRADGRILVGSTKEDVGFDCHPTAGAVRDFLEFATWILPDTANAELERCWAGLRPESPDGLPYLGQAPDVNNLFVASGHYMWGLFQSPATAVILSALMQDKTPPLDVSAFRLNRDQ